jgi:NADH:ubiquinone oxidoreductase subunit 5 (subunit L)/multisubunit Na+/H+ antiporter MnhA subunit
MPFPALLLIAATLLPLGGFMLLLFMGKRLGAPLAGYVGAFFVALSFLCSGWAMMRWLGTGSYRGTPWGKGVAPLVLSWRWIDVGAAGIGQQLPPIDFSLHLDSLTVGMFVTITLVAMLVHIFSARSMRRDPRFARFFACLSLATFAVLGLLVSGTLLQLLLFLELLSFAAVLLIGFRANREQTARAVSRTFVFHRIGDVAFILGAGILFGFVGNLKLADLWLALGDAGTGQMVVLADGRTFPPALLTAAGVALCLGAASRCAQFPLHAWAVDAAQAVAPTCTMIFSAALAPAAVYVVARLFPLLTPSARLFVAITGCTTLGAAALIAAVQRDLKKILIAAAVSQLGMMILALGAGSWVGALFFLVTYAFFQSLLFLAVGGVIRAGRGETDVSRLGGLMRQMPLTAVVFAIGILAVCGVGWGNIGLSGYESRKLVLSDIGAFAALAVSLGRSGAYRLLFVVPVAGTLLIAFALTRCWMLTFWGEPRDRRLFDHAREVPTLFWPLVILAAMTGLSGRWLGVREMLDGAVLESRQALRVAADSSDAYRGKATHAFDAVWPSEDPGEDEASGAEAASGAVTAARTIGRQWAGRWMWIACVTGIASAVLLYLRGFAAANLLARVAPLRWVGTWLLEWMYFDDLYDALIVVPAVGTARLLAWFDRMALDGLSHLVGSSFQKLGSGAAALDRRLTGSAGAPVASPTVRRALITLLTVAAAGAAAWVLVVSTR